MDDTELLLDIIVIVLIIIITQAFRVLWHYFKVKALPESAVLIILGAVTGGFLLVIVDDVEDTVFQFENEVFVLVLLPPIILAAGYAIQRRLFFNNLGTIIVFAVIGTFLAALLTGIGVYVWSVLGLMDTSFTIFEALTFGSLISAVDPVAVLAVFEEAHADHNLAIILEGESILNDAVSIVLYRVFLSLVEEGKSLTVGTVFESIGTFFAASFGGIAIGFACALLAALSTRWSRTVQVLEVLFILCWGYLSYVLSELGHLSGIMAILFFGITSSKYVLHNITHYSHITTNFMIKLLASVAETIIFVLLGIVVVTEPQLDWDWSFNVFTLVLVVVVRIVCVTSMSFLVNLRRAVKISGRSQFVLIWGALRGAIAFSLAFGLHTDNGIFGNKQAVIACTLFIVLFTIFFNGSLMRPLLKLLRIKVAKEETIAARVLGKVIPLAVSAAQVIIGRSNFLAKTWKPVDEWIYKVFCRPASREDRVMGDALDACLMDGVMQQYSHFKVSAGDARMTRVLSSFQQSGRESNVETGISDFSPSEGEMASPYPPTPPLRGEGVGPVSPSLGPPDRSITRSRAVRERLDAFESVMRRRVAVTEEGYDELPGHMGSFRALSHAHNMPSKPYGNRLTMRERKLRQLRYARLLGDVTKVTAADVIAEVDEDDEDVSTFTLPELPSDSDHDAPFPHQSQV